MLLPERWNNGVEEVGQDEEDVFAVIADEDEEGEREVQAERDADDEDGDGDQEVGAKSPVDGQEHLEIDGG